MLDEAKKEKYISHLKRLIMEMDQADAGEKEEGDSPFSELADNEEAKEEQSSDDENPLSEDTAGAMSEEDLKSMFKEKNGLPKKIGVRSFSLAEKSPMKSASTKFGKKGRKG